MDDRHPTDEEPEPNDTAPTSDDEPAARPCCPECYGGPTMGCAEGGDCLCHVSVVPRDFCGRIITGRARRLCGGCANAWAEARGAQPMGCGAAL